MSSRAIISSGLAHGRATLQQPMGRSGRRQRCMGMRCPVAGRVSFPEGMRNEGGASRGKLWGFGFGIWVCGLYQFFSLWMCL